MIFFHFSFSNNLQAVLILFLTASIHSILSNSAVSCWICTFYKVFKYWYYNGCKPQPVMFIILSFCQRRPPMREPATWLLHFLIYMKTEKVSSVNTRDRKILYSTQGLLSEWNNTELAFLSCCVVALPHPCICAYLHAGHLLIYFI